MWYNCYMDTDTVSVRIRKSTKEHLEAIAESEHRKIGAQIEVVFKEWLEQKTPRPLPDWVTEPFRIPFVLSGAASPPPPDTGPAGAE